MMFFLCIHKYYIQRAHTLLSQHIHIDFDLYLKTGYMTKNVI